MSSDTKAASKTDEEEDTVSSILGTIKARLRPLLMRKWKGSQADAVADVMSEGLSAEELRIYLRGFKRGYWNGAVDVSSLKPGDLQSKRQPSTEKPKVH